MDRTVETESVLIRADNLELGYPGRAVIRGMNLCIRSGEFWFLIGPNGEGKTTVVKSVLGMLPPRSGEFWLNPRFDGRKGIGFVPQRSDPNPSLPTTVKEFVRLGLVGLPRQDPADDPLEWALDKVGLGGFRDRDYWSLSGGQKQRVLVARALVRRPILLVADEPTNGMDLPTKEGFMRSLSRLNREDGVTVLFVTHEIELAAEFATHVALFHGGRVRAGPAPDILRSEILREAYETPVEVLRSPDGVVTAIRTGEKGIDR
jgi:ABC-type Mn2+/Zn2+ transport system ATPase subunit